uniref:C2H2-type domain-containing protein n=1 Tax=Glossina pallidipes TaxID=7398 RepID=A0A1A9ZRJ9_GLOPL
MQEFQVKECIGKVSANAIEKLENCLITQYKNLHPEQNKIPVEIKKIFVRHKNYLHISLCSDDEFDDDESNGKIANGIDGDLEIIDMLPSTSSHFQENTVKKEQILNPLEVDLTETSHVMNEFDVVALSLSEDEEKKLFKRRSDFLNFDVNNRKLTAKKKICSPSLPVMETISLDSSSSEDDDSAAENNFKKLLRPLFANLAAESKIVQSQQQEEEVAGLTSLENGNSEYSENISSIINKSINGNKVDQNQGISNHNVAQSFTDGIGIEELLASLESLNQGHQLEDFQLQWLQTLQTQQNCKASTSEEEPHKNVRNNYTIRNTIRPVNHFPSETNPIISSNFTPQTHITSGLYPDNFLNSNQYSTTNGIPPQFFYPANINTYMRQPNRATQRKLNMSDPRILKHLQGIQNSPLFSIVAANSQRSIPHFEFQRNQTGASTSSCQTNYPATALLQLAYDNNGQPRKSYNGSTGRRSSITYGEYKQRKAEEHKKNIDQLNEARQRKAAEKQAKDTLAAEKIEKQELDKQQDQTRLILRTKSKGQFEKQHYQIHSIPQYSKDEMQAASNEYKRNSESTNGTTNQTTNVSPTIQISGSPSLAKANNITETFLHTTSTVKANNETKQLRHPISTAIDKVYKTLECTVKGYSQFEHFTPKLLGAKRRSSISARDIISKQLDIINSPIKRNHKRKRHSDIEKDAHALRTANSNDSNARTSPAPEKINRKRKYAVESRQMNVNSHDPVEQQLLKQPGPFQKSSKQSHIDIEPMRCKELDVSLVAKGRPLLEIAGDGNMTGNIKGCGIANNDYEMTELNTFFCVLCPSKPTDITNHYIRKHKTESYVSRLTMAKLNDLIQRTNFAEFQGVSDCHLARFKVTCPFCEDIIIHRFSSLYDHYSKHTGEYAYMCSQCSYNKPFRADIQSHQQNSKRCRKANLRIVYRYPPNTTVIYLYYCSLCNYVQLNETNVFKHLREHHNPRETAEGNVQKCILTAMQQVTSNTQIYERTSSLTSTESKSNEEIIDVLQKELKSAVETVTSDEDAAFSNERCAEDTEIKEEAGNLFQDQWKENPILKTVVHCPISTDASATLTKMSSKVPTQNVRQFIKCEEGIDETYLTQLGQYPEPVKYTQCAPVLNESRFTYRLLPANGTYLGLYKCMANDCYFSSNKVEDILSHLKDHANSECRPIEYIQCAYCVLRFDCPSGFFATYHLHRHIELIHKIFNFNLDTLKYYSCIYCRTSGKSVESLRNHLALHHPSELPVICDHNVTADFMEDSVQSLELVNLAVRVPAHLLKDVSDNRSSGNVLK